MSVNPHVDLIAKALIENFRVELTKTFRLMTGAMNAVLDQLEAAERKQSRDSEASS